MGLKIAGYDVSPAGIVGAGAGFMIGGPAGAAVGYGIGSGLDAGKEAGKRADAAMNQAAGAAKSQLEISQRQLDLADEQWKLYKDNIYPLELEAQKLGLDYKKIAQQQYKDYYAPLGNQFAQDAMDGVEAQPERAARDARLSVDQQFDTEEGMMQRNLERRGVRPGSGSYESGMADTSLNRASAKAYNVNRAVEYERDRVEDVNFNRKAVALGRSPMISGGTTGVNAGLGPAGLVQAGQTAGNAGRQFGNISNAYGNAAGDIVSGGIQLGAQAYDIYNKYSSSRGGGGVNVGFNPTSFTPNYSPAASPDGFAPTSFNSYSAPTGVSGGGVDIGFQPQKFADGGQVNAPTLGRGNPDGGQVNGAPGVDQVPAYIEGDDGTKYPAKLTDKEFVVPADVMKVIGTGVIEDIIEKARMRKQQANQSPNALTRRA